MKIELSPLENIYLKSSPAYKLRYPILTCLCFLGTFVVLLGSFWEDIGTLSLFASLAFLALSVWGIFSRERTNYYLTNLRLVSTSGQIALQELADVSIRRASLSSLRNIGDLSLETTTGQWLVFKRVKDPESVKAHILKVRDAARGQTETSSWATIPAPQTPEQTLPVAPSETPRAHPVTWLRRHRKWISVSIFLILLFTALGVYLASCPDIQIVNSTFLVRPGDYVPYSFTETRSGNHEVWGGFASNNTVSMYLMNASQFASFSSTGAVGSYLYTSGATTSYSVPTEPCYTRGCVRPSAVVIQEGVYYLVFSNPNNSVWAKINITSPMIADTC